MRRTCFGAVSATLLLLASGCGSGGEQQETADPQEVSGEITFWDTSDATNEAPVFEELVEEFNDTYPQVTVNYENVPFDDAQDNFKTAAQSGEGAPDVMRVDVAWVPEMASLGYLAPLDGTRALQESEDFLETPLSSTRHKGQTYAVPQVTDSLGLLYNKDLLEEAGVDSPPETMEELREAGLTVAEETDADGFYVNASDGFYLLPHYYAHGGDLLDTREKRITVNSDTGVAAVEEVLDLIDSGAAAEPALTDTYATMQTAFKEGEVAMIFNGPWAMEDIRAGSAFSEDLDNMGVAPVPAGPEGQGGPTGGHDYAVYAGSEQLDASYLFTRFMASEESQARIAAELGLLPTRSSVYERDSVAGNHTVSAFTPVVEDAQPGVWIPQSGTLFEPFETEIPAAVSGETTPEQALDAIADRYSSSLPEEWE
ncbi:carbohydrate ABC transporter substrate-binding protein (CUT1 family) [Haloactinospora alba]|uniref:Carbohydrate ABC transporter substrate-binding protein (CUT1 family) n=1 Tax=Haloactinospora alba TaxID=405555 RepID=A0A543NIE5_9ACTN|nr:extracellular solute-binding protein [Haloactinospora alba]TQN31612.1 carbohydrate ABC transporter substrate-binding protein (CUT1 family) [Haloactinospora alba]